MTPLAFFGYKSKKDPQKFLDSVQKVIGIMGVTFNESVDLTSYQLQGVSHTWFM